MSSNNPGENSESIESELDTFVSARRFRMLVADDEVDARGLLEIVLDDEQWNVEFCENGELAIAACQRELPDLVISDIQMPGRNGIEVCRWVKENCGSTFVPVILLTCQAELCDKINGLNCGADDYITKPFALPELEARVRALLRIKVLTDKLKETQDLLEEQEKQLVTVQVAGAAAHELGQPLTSVLLNCQMIGQLAPGSDEFNQAIRVIQEQCMRMKNILSKFNEIRNYKTRSYPGDLRILDLE